MTTLVLAALGLAAVLLHDTSRSSDRAHPGVATERAVGANSSSVADDAPALLRVWDARRAAAWASGDRAGLEALYVPGSAAGRRDLAMLTGYLRRGLRVEGMATQVLALRVVRRTSHRLVLLVTDRVVGATVADAVRRIALPRDAATTRRSVLQRLDGHWLVAQVHPA